MKCLRALTLLILLVLLSCSAHANDRQLGSFLSEMGQLRFQLSDGIASSSRLLQVQVETDERNQLWKTIYSSPSDDVIYVFPLSPDALSFLIAENLGSGYRTLILHIDTPQSISVQLDASGKDFPEVIQIGTENTRFVTITNASKIGNILDVTDIYALQGRTYKMQERVPYGQKLMALVRLSQQIDRAASEQRKGMIVRP